MLAFESAGVKFGVAFAAVWFCISAAQACDLTKDPRPTWEQMIDQADVVFVGHVVSTEPETAIGWGRALFEVETWIKGGSGRQFEAAQGSGSNCVREFQIGQKVIFAGDWLEVSGEAPIAVADDTGWDPVVFLDDPPTVEQQAQLDYLTKILERSPGQAPQGE